MKKYKRSTKTAFSLLDLLVVMALITIILSLIFPAVQTVREAARKAQCCNNLKQLGLSCHLYVDSHNTLPTGGWGHLWVGDPNYGVGRQQPGGWVFNLLPYIEQQSLHGKAQGLSQSLRREALHYMLNKPVALFNCPSRRSAIVLPYRGSEPIRNTEAPENVAKSDYAINGGSDLVNSGPGPLSTRRHDMASYVWPNPTMFNGVSFVRSTVKLAQVTDGLSHTYLIGEKYVNASRDDGNGGDDQAMYIGDDADIRRWGQQPPLQDFKRIDSRSVFGSRHLEGCQFVFTDGSVRLISFGVDSDIHRSLANRHDGKSLDASQ